MVEAILFDMDGVLVDSEPVHARAADDALAAFGLAPVTPQDYDRYFLGQTDLTALRGYLSALGLADIPLDAVLRRKAAAFARRFADEVRPQPDGLETLRAAAACGWLVAIVSGGLASEIAMVVERFGLAPYLQAIVNGDEVPEGKPNPRPYLLGAERLGRAPERCLVIEDAPAGVAAARAAGMRCLAVDRLGRPETLAQADRVVPELTMAAVEELAGGAARPDA